METEDAVIEVMAKTSQGTSGNGPNPFRAQFGEILPIDVQRNFIGFLVEKDTVPFKLILKS